MAALTGATAPHPLSPARDPSLDSNQTRLMGSADPPRRPPTAGIARLEASGCSVVLGLGLLIWHTRPRNSGVGWNDAMRVEVLGADGQGRMTLSARSVRRYSRLEVLSNYLASVDSGPRNTREQLAWERWRT